MSDSDMKTLDNSAAVEVAGKIMVVAIIVLFLVVVLVLFLHLYAKWFWWRVEERHPSGSSNRRGRRRRFVFSPGQDSAMPARRGLEPAVLRSLPVVIYKPEDFKEELECAVCLCEVAESEKVRLLPKCNHGFHLDCIDMWFQSHSTCPLCRNSVGVEWVDSDSDTSSFSSIHDLEEGSNLGDGNSMESPVIPTNMLFWGDESQVSSRNGCLGSEEVASGESPSSTSSSNARPDGVLVIDIPRGVSDNAASTSGCAQEEVRSPVVARLKSLKRLLSREARVNPCSPTSSDIEQGKREPY